MAQSRSFEATTIPGIEFLEGINRVKEFFDKFYTNFNDSDTLVSIMSINRNLRDCAYQIYIVLTIIVTSQSNDIDSADFIDALKSTMGGLHPRLKRLLKSMLELEKESINQTVLPGDKAVNNAIRSLDIWS